MAKTKDELTQIKQEYETINNKLMELTEEELKMVTGGVNMEISKQENTATIYMNIGSYSVNAFYAEIEMMIYKHGGADALNACGIIRSTLNTYKNIITKCVVNLNTYEPVYYVGDTAYSQTQIDQGILNQ